MKVVEKPWGRETTLEANEHYAFKKLEMNAGHRCSLQYHAEKHETIYVHNGILQVTTGDTVDNLSDRILKEGDVIIIPPGQIHRMKAIETAIYLEASTPHMNDVVRLSDDYGRLQ